VEEAGGLRAIQTSEVSRLPKSFFVILLNL
jgi:hypothetical protein